MYFYNFWLTNGRLSKSLSPLNLPTMRNIKFRLVLLYSKRNETLHHCSHAALVGVEIWDLRFFRTSFRILISSLKLFSYQINVRLKCISGHENHTLFKREIDHKLFRDDEDTHEPWKWSDTGQPMQPFSSPHDPILKCLCWPNSVIFIQTWLLVEEPDQDPTSRGWIDRFIRCGTQSKSS